MGDRRDEVNMDELIEELLAEGFDFIALLKQELAEITPDVPVGQLLQARWN